MAAMLQMSGSESAAPGRDYETLTQLPSTAERAKA